MDRFFSGCYKDLNSRRFPCLGCSPTVGQKGPTGAKGGQREAVPFVLFLFSSAPGGWMLEVGGWRLEAEELLLLLPQSFNR